MGGGGMHMSHNLQDKDVPEISNLTSSLRPSACSVDPSFLPEKPRLPPYHLFHSRGQNPLPLFLLSVPRYGEKDGQTLHMTSPMGLAPKVPHHRKLMRLRQTRLVSHPTNGIFSWKKQR